MITQLPPVSENKIISIKGSDSAPEGPRPIQPVSLDAKQGRRDPRFGGPRADPQVPHHAVHIHCQRASLVPCEANQVLVAYKVK